MQALNLITLIFVIAGGVELGFRALGFPDMIEITFGADSWLSRTMFGIIGISALWQVVPYVRAFSMGESAAEADLPPAAPAPATEPASVPKPTPAKAA